MSDECGNSFLMTTPDGRRWRVEVFGPGEKVKVTDIDHPLGWHEWVTAKAAGIKWFRTDRAGQARAEIERLGERR